MQRKQRHSLYPQGAHGLLGELEFIKKTIVNQCENHTNQCAQFIEGQMHFLGFIAKTCNNETHEECQQFARQMRMRWPFQKKEEKKETTYTKCMDIQA